MEAEGILRSPVSCALSMHSSPRYLPLSRKIEVSSLLQFAGKKKKKTNIITTQQFWATKSQEIMSYFLFHFFVFLRVPEVQHAHHQLH